MNMGKKINEYETAGFQISEYDELSSTNTEAERWPKEELKDKSVILTYCQTQGRGQATNRWESEPGKNLSMTVVLCPPDCDASRNLPFRWCVPWGYVILSDTMQREER